MKIFGKLVEILNKLFGKIRDSMALIHAARKGDTQTIEALLN